MTRQVKHLYEFGPFRMDTVECLLLRNKQVVPLTPKLFEILQVLVENSGHLLEKDELMKAVWPDAFVEEGSLTRNISALRKVMGESENGHQYIETVPTRGYRFAASVKELLDEDADLIVQERSKLHLIVDEETEAVAPDKYANVEQVTQEQVVTRGRWANRVVRRSPSILALAAFVMLVVLAASLSYFWTTSAPKLPAASAAAKSIAVLPFKPLAADSRNESLELGMADTLINKLSPIRQVIVRPISEVRKYTRLDQDPIAAGRELQVDYVLEGNLQMVGDKTRATVRLLSVRDGSAIWTDKCDQACSNIFELQDAIAERMAGALALELTGNERGQLAKHSTDSTEAYELYILGRYYQHKYTKEGFEKSIEYCREAIKIDPNYAQAHVGLFNAYSNLGLRGFLPPKGALQEAERAAVKAVELDDALGEAHTALGYIKKSNWDWSGAEKEFKRALELDPNSVEANKLYTAYLQDVGRADEAIVYAKRMEELDPLTTAGLLGYAYFGARRYDRAIELYLKATERNPNGAQEHFFLGEACLAKGMYEEGVAELKKAVAIENAPERWDRRPMLAYGYAVSGRRDEAQKLLDEQKELAKQRYISPYNFAIIYTGLGDKDRALEWLEKAYEEHSQPLVHVKSRPLFDSLRSDPRYIDLLRRMNLAP